MKQNLIPPFIVQKNLESKHSGNFSGGVMFIDIVGFTALTDSLISHGRAGAETITNIINMIFEPAISEIQKYGGWISSFAGDAFLAVFPEENLSLMVDAAIKINTHINGLKIETKFGKFRIQIRTALSTGRIEWKIVKGAGRKTYYFLGEGFEQVFKSISIADPGEIIVSSSLKKNVKSFSFKQKKKGYYIPVDKTGKIHPVNIIKSNDPEDYSIDEFIPEEILNLNIQGEFRNITSIFISFDKEEREEEFLNSILKKTDEFGGYFNKTQFTEKGKNLLILFGAPIAYENSLNRALSFILSLKGENRFKFHAGITSGIAFTGFIGSNIIKEYTALGDIVNISSRLMFAAKTGEVLIPESLAKHINRDFETEYKGQFKLKGKKIQIKVFNLTGILKTFEKHSFLSQFIGRESILKILTEKINKIKSGKFSGLTYIYGEPGFGKTRLLSELSLLNEVNVQTIKLKADEIRKRSLGSFSTFLKEFFIPEDISETKKSALFKKRFKEFLEKIEKSGRHPEKSNIIKELTRLQVFLTALLDFRKKNKEYEQFNPQIKFENIAFGLKELFKGLSLIKPVLIILEDLHWFDEDSKIILSKILNNLNGFPLFFIASSRYKDDGTKPVIPLKGDVSWDDLELKPLNTEETKIIAEDIMNFKISDEINSFIFERCQGNPFFIEQFCSYLLENQLIEFNGDCLIFREKTSEIPEGITNIIISRIDRLSAKVKALLHTASILGLEFDIKIISNMLKGTDVENILHSGQKEMLWHPITKLKYIFQHAILRETAYQMQLRKRLIELHKLAAESMVSVYKNFPESYGDIAYHFEQAEMNTLAKKYYKEAFEFCKSNFRNEAAKKFGE
ncbi:MAG: adenylate/guanylate cyclase domain-containing protein, partial [bacterium]|nr:adenylate/guanylate cyclase domain-containing protein [bacterium]